MRVQVFAWLAVAPLREAFVVGGPSLTARSRAVASLCPRQGASLTTRRAAGEDKNGDLEEAGAADVDVDALIDSLTSFDSLGGKGSAVAGAGSEDGGVAGRGGVEAATSSAVADLQDPGKLVREAAKPFREEMDRIEADFQRSVAAKEEEIERKLEEMLKSIDGTSK